MLYSSSGDGGLYDKSVKGFSFIEIASAAIGHEIEHTTEENVIPMVNKGKAEADKIIDETNQLKTKK